MFWFTTPSTRESAPNNPVVSAIKQGAERTGTGFDYLLKTAQRESALDPEAKAKTSSATGLFQFVEQTWLSTVRQEGPKLGLSTYANAISADEAGRLSVSDPAMREKILNLRNNPQVAAIMAGALTQKNRDQLAATLGRQPQASELYMAHVLGARGASDLIRMAATDPKRSAARDFPEAAAANRALFYDKSGRARSAQELYGLLSAHHTNTQLASATAGQAADPAGGAAQPAPIAAALAPGRAKGLIGLFSTEGSRQPVSKAVANLWTTPRSESSRLGTDDTALRYFPRQSRAGDNLVAAADASAPAPATTMMAPLPPVRPPDLAVADKNQNKQKRQPLDLSAFMVQRNRV